MSDTHYLIVNEEERVVGIYTDAEEAVRHLSTGELLIQVYNGDLCEETVALFYLPRLEDLNPIDMETLVDSADEHDAELAELFQRVSALEEDVYGSDRPLIEVTLEEKDDLN